MNNTTDNVDIKPKLRSLIKFEEDNQEDIFTACNPENPNQLAIQITLVKEEPNNEDIENENYDFDNANDLITFEIDEDVRNEVFVKEEYYINDPAKESVNTYVCKFCSRIFEDWKTLLKHNLMHLTLKLERCDKNLRNKASKTKNTNGIICQPDSKTGLWHCIVCNKRCNKYKSWFQHVTEVHTAFNYVCEFCQKLYHTNTGMTRHLKVVHNHVKLKYLTKNASPCTLCKAVLDNKHALKTHMRTVHSSKSFECDLCGLKYKCFPYLQTHKRRVHKETGQFICDICYASFKSRRRLLIHIRRPHVRLEREKSGLNKIRSFRVRKKRPAKCESDTDSSS